MDIEQLIKDGDTEELQTVIKRYFNNDYELFFKYVIDEGYIEMSDDIDDSIYDLYPKNIIKYWMVKNPEKTIDYIIDRHLSDVKKEDGKYYMELSDLSDLKFLFRSDAKNFVESILSNDYDPYHYSFSDFGMELSNLIGDLDTKSKIEMSNYLSKHVGQFVEYNGDDNTISSYVESDESGDMFKLTSERLEEIMGDDDSISSLLTDSPEFHELGFLLTNAYGDAYSTAERDAYYNKTMDELKDFFETQDLGYWGTKEGFTYDKEGKRIPRIKDIYFVNITKVIKQMIIDTVDNNMSDFDEYNAFDNLGSFEWILKEYYADEIRLNLDRVSPDYGDVDTLFNEYFRDNI
jgi:hypothetical protein